MKARNLSPPSLEKTVLIGLNVIAELDTEPLLVIALSTNNHWQSIQMHREGLVGNPSEI